MPTLCLLLSISITPDAAAALLDRSNLADDAIHHTYYLSVSTTPPEQREAVVAALRFVLPSVSRAVVLERQLPAEVEGANLHRIDLRGLHWDRNDFLTVLKHHPYSPGIANPLVVRADWLIHELTDAFETDAYYRLLYGGANIPQTRDEFLKFWQVSDDPQHRIGLIEGQSGVALARKRWIESRPTANRGYAWGTRDSANIVADSDPLEDPLGEKFVHEAEEWIVGIPKVSLASGRRGVLQVYLLANGQGRRQDRAPADIVEDATRFRGLPEIRTAGSCIQCHGQGINSPTINELRALVAAGVDLFADFKSQEAIERFHFADLEREIARNNEDFATIVSLCNGLTAEENARAFRSAIDFYDADVTLAQAARELYATPDELKLALAFASAATPLGARLSLLAHDRAMPRTVWEEQYASAFAALAKWRKHQTDLSKGTP